MGADHRTEIYVLMEEVKAEMDKFYDKGNKSAGLRARKAQRQLEKANAAFRKYSIAVEKGEVK